MNDPTSQELDRRIDAIESAYEFMLAYAAQGFEPNSSSSQEQDMRTRLTAMDEALFELGAVVASVAEATDGEQSMRYQTFIAAVTQDADKALGAVRLVMARSGISSQLIDNLNASIHLRALLTDLFLLDEAFKH